MVARILDKGLVPIPEAAAELGCDLKRFRGYVHRDRPDMDDPIGSLATDEVYGWSLKALAERATDTDTEVPRG